MNKSIIFWLFVTVCVVSSIDQVQTAPLPAPSPSVGSFFKKIGKGIVKAAKAVGHVAEKAVAVVAPVVGTYLEKAGSALSNVPGMGMMAGGALAAAGTGIAILGDLAKPKPKPVAIDTTGTVGIVADNTTIPAIDNNLPLDNSTSTYAGQTNVTSTNTTAPALDKYISEKRYQRLVAGLAPPINRTINNNTAAANNYTWIPTAIFTNQAM